MADPMAKYAQAPDPMKAYAAGAAADPMAQYAPDPMAKYAAPEAPVPFSPSSMFQDAIKAAEEAQLNKDIRMGLAIERTEAKHKALIRKTAGALGPMAPPEEAREALDVLGKAQARRMSPPWRSPELMTEIAPEAVPGTTRPKFAVQSLLERYAPTEKQAVEAMRKGEERHLREPSGGLFPQPPAGPQLKGVPHDPKSVLGQADLLLWALPRAATGLGKGVQDAAREVVKAPSPEIVEQAKEHIVERAWRSFTGEHPVAAADVFEEAHRAAKGGAAGGKWEQKDVHGNYVHKLGPGENVFVQGMGLVTELWYGGRILKTLRPMPTRPVGPIIGQQMRQALVKTGASPGSISEFERLGQFIAQSHIHPKRLQDGMRYVRRLARKYGADEKMAESWFVKIVGSQGEALGKRGLAGVLGRRYAAKQQKKLAPLLEEQPAALRSKIQPVPTGAEYSGPLADELRLAAGQVQYKAGKPQGFVDIMRVPQSYEMTQTYKAGRGARQLRKELGLLDEPIGRHIDVKARLDAETSEIAQLMTEHEALVAKGERKIASLEGVRERLISTGDDAVSADIETLQRNISAVKGRATRARRAMEVKIAEKRAGAERSLERAGMTREEALAPLQYAEGELGEAQRRLVNQARLQQRQWRRKEIADGVEGEEINNYVQRFEEMESRERRVKGISIGTEGAGKAGEDFTKHRAAIEYAPGPGAEVQEVMEFSRRWANRRRAHGLADSTAMMTNDAVKYYGRRVPDEWLNHTGIAKRLEGKPISPHDIRMEFHELMATRGLDVAHIKVGNFKGEAVVMDREAGRLLHRLADPEKTSEALRVAENISNWWRARATIFRTGFVVRNTIGNTLQLWQADVALKDIPKRYAQGAQVLARRSARLPLGDQKRYHEVLDSMFGKDVFTGKPLKIEGYTADELVDIMEEYKQFRSSFMTQEVGGSQPMQPIGMGLPARDWPTVWKEKFNARLEALKKGKVREAAFGPARKGKLGEFLFKSRVSPVSQNFAMMPINKVANTIAEEVAHAGLFIDRLAKGFKPWEAMEAVAKHLYYYDELSKGAQVARSMSSFFTWYWKTWGRQVADLALKPDKASTFMRAFYGSEELDPLTEQERIYEASMDPSDREYKLNWRIPFARGEPVERVERIGRHKNLRYESKRKYAMWAGVAPQAAVQQMQPGKAIAEFAGILHPAFHIPELLLEKAEQERTFPGFFGTYAGTRKAPLRTAPRWATPLMDRAKELGVDSLVGGLLQLEAVKEDYVVNLVNGYMRGIRNPDRLHEYAEQKSRTLRYKWPAMLPDIITKIDPAFGTVNRLLQATDEKTYDAVIATLLGFKPREYGLEEAMVDYERQQTRALEELGVNTKKQIQLNKRIDKRNPFRHIFQ